MRFFFTALFLIAGIETSTSQTLSYAEAIGKLAGACGADAASGSYSAQIPPGDLKSGMPLSVEIPAPVRTTQGRRSRTSAARSGTV